MSEPAPRGFALAAALLARRPGELGDGPYLERADADESALEEYLRGALARLPRRAPRRGFVAAVNRDEARLRRLGEAGLAAAFRASCLSMRRGGFADEALAAAFAAIREAADRTLGMRHFDVQLLGGRTLLDGRIAEMNTGEGKTLVATLAACTAAAAGAAVHVVTVNDYLAGRDAATNTPLYAALGLTVGVIRQDMPPDERRAQYARDVVYVSNKELVFDYLKDRIAAGDTLAAQLRIQDLYRPRRPAPPLLRGLHVAIVDEADSVLIDEARTPLIISATEPDQSGGEIYRVAIDLARRLRPREHYELTDERDIDLKPAADAAIAAQLAGRGGVWASPLWRHELLQQALSALHCFQRDRQYIVSGNKVQIVDEFTGRVMPDRTWERGLHQMIEAKESCEITGQRKTLARITYQRFFRRYLLLCGMTGTASEVRAELRRVYDLEVVAIPPHKPGQRKRLADRCWRTQDERWREVAGRAAQLSREGRAILIGTRSVAASELLSAQLAAQGVEHRVLNARQDQDEAEAIARAGHGGRITVATNMAGRGTDIRPAPGALATGGLHVILTEFHESTRIDRQLFGRSARQGEPGTVEAMVSIDDELFLRFSPDWRVRLLGLVPRGRPIPAPLLKLLVRYAQFKAEWRSRGIRMQTLRQDKQLQRALGFAGARR